MTDQQAGAASQGLTVGVLGGGQLGRMLAYAAFRRGCAVHVLDPDPDCPAGQVAQSLTCAAYDDIDAAVAFARGVDVITFEFENVPADTLEAVQAIRPTRPSPHVLETCRHRAMEKNFLQSIGVQVAPFAVCESAADVQTGAKELGLPCILKTSRFGYDGKGQTRIEPGNNTADAWTSLATDEAVLEKVIDFDREISVIVARSVDGQMTCYPPVENRHRNHILDVTLAPAPGIDDSLSQHAQSIARRIAQAFELVGVLAVEMFVLPGDDPTGRVLVNELAPRPHNSGHYTLDACVTDQFEQQWRTATGHTPGNVTLRHPAAVMVNLLGDLWFDPQGNFREPDWSAVLAERKVKLHLYGKTQARPGRKMGHMTMTGSDGQAMETKLLALRDQLAKSLHD